MTLKRLLYVLLLILFLDKSAFAKYDLSDQYSKSEFKITMRDGIKLHTIVYSPKDTSKLYPILLLRTPYSISPYGPDDLAVPEKLIPHPDLISKGYIFVFQDARGTFKSEGNFSDIRPPRKNDETFDESTDNYDTIDYLINNIENNNGRVGQWGISHSGWYTAMGLIDAHPALKAASPQATTGDPFIGDDAHRNGIYRLMPRMAWAYQQISGTAPDRYDPSKIVIKPDFGTNWGYEFFLNVGPIDKINETYFKGQLGSEWEDVMAHPNYDEYYQRRHIPKYMKNVLVPTLNVMAWFDAPDPYGTIATYQGIEKLSPENKSILVAGPWVHGGWLSSKGEELGEISFGQKTSDYYNKNILVPFFEHHLKGTDDYKVVEAHMFETGGNKWHQFEQWPPKAMKAIPIYFNDDFRLTFDKPMINGEDSYINDPMSPVPYSTKIEFGYAYGAYRIEDQRIASTRPDVLSYTTNVLDRDVTIAGPVIAKLITETTGTDADWFIKVIDVFPASDENNPGYHMLVGAEGMRAKYRKSFSDPEPVKPNEETQINFEVRDKFHTFKAGHKIMVQVHSTWFPVYDRNPGQFMNIYGANKEDYLKTKQTIHRKVKNSSHLVLPILVR